MVSSVTINSYTSVNICIQSIDYVLLMAQASHNHAGRNCQKRPRKELRDVDYSLPYII